MRKLISVILVCLMVFSTGGAVLAQGQSPAAGTGSGAPAAAGQQSGNDGQAGQFGEAYQAGLRQMVQTRSMITANREQVVQLRERIGECALELKLQIREMLQEREQISPEQMTQLRNALQFLNQERVQLQAERQGKIAEQVALMRQARNGGDLEAAQDALEKIQAEQQQRIRDMNRIMNEMQELLDELSE